MRLVIQRVLRASVHSQGRLVASTQGGYVVLVGIDRTDTLAECRVLAEKLVRVRLYSADKKLPFFFSTPSLPPASPTAIESAARISDNNAAGALSTGGGATAVDQELKRPPRDQMWAANVVECGGDLLLVSQFTLAHQMKGNKPDFHNAMTTEGARTMFDAFVTLVEAAYEAVVMETFLPPRPAPEGTTRKQKQKQQRREATDDSGTTNAVETIEHGSASITATAAMVDAPADAAAVTPAGGGVELNDITMKTDGSTPASTAVRTATTAATAPTASLPAAAGVSFPLTARLRDFIATAVTAAIGTAVVRKGNFGHYMEVSLVGDGPVTIVLDCADGKISG